jgi:hypothetical protein
MGPATAACKKLEVNILPRNWTVLMMKPQVGIGFPFAPLRRVTDGLLVEEQGIMLNVAPVSTKNSVICQFVCEKDQTTDICREMHGSGCCRRAFTSSAAL